MQAAASVIRWPQPITEYVGFIGSLLPAGAIGFRYVVMRGALARSEQVSAGANADWRRVYSDTARRAALIGLIGVVVAIALMLYQLPGLAARRHTTVGQLLTHTPAVELQAGFLVLALIGFALAFRGTNVGWPLATVCFLAALLRNGLLGEWKELANPIHVLSAGLWIGVGSSRVDLQACKLEYSIVSPK